MQLGDAVSEALSLIGLTPVVVHDWIGASCGCDQRRHRLNALGNWALHVLRRGKIGALEHLNRMMDDG